MLYIGVKGASSNLDANPFLLQSQRESTKSIYNVKKHKELLEN